MEVLAHISCYNELVAAIRARKDQLGLSNDALDDLASMPRGWAGKVLGPSHSKGIGAVTLEAYLMVLAFDLVMVTNRTKLRAMKPDYRGRVTAQLRANHPLTKAAFSRVQKILSERGIAALKAAGRLAYISSLGGRSRMASMTPQERQELGRKAARARWANQRRLPSRRRRPPPHPGRPAPTERP